MRFFQVLVTSLSLQQVDYLEPANFWLGPRAADLIHLGAKYSPCMRRDARIIKEMEKWREKERDTACCIRNDDSGCVQSSHADCSVSVRAENSRRNRNCRNAVILMIKIFSVVLAQQYGTGP